MSCIYVNVLFYVAATPVVSSTEICKRLGILLYSKNVKKSKL